MADIVWSNPIDERIAVADDDDDHAEGEGERLQGDGGPLVDAHRREQLALVEAEIANGHRERHDCGSDPVNVSVFSRVDAALLEPLPYPGPERLAPITRVPARRRRRPANL